MSLVVCIRGGGDLGSGAALRLHRAGMRVVVCELAKPLVVRRTVAFAEAIYSTEITVEGVRAKCVSGHEEVIKAWAEGVLPVTEDPNLALLTWLEPDVLVDARLLKKPVDFPLQASPLVIGLGPGFTAGVNCHAVVETKRGHNLGRVYWQGAGEPDSGVPEMVLGYVEERVLRAPTDGLLKGLVTIGQRVVKGQPLVEVEGQLLTAGFDGVVRGLLANNVTVKRGMKIGDLDPRFDENLVTQVSDKSLAVGGGVLEAVLSRPELRARYSG